MNPELPPSPQEALEQKITALVLGELSVEEATALRAKISADPELTDLVKRLERAVGLVRTATQEVPSNEIVEELRLNSQRRESLLAHFKTAAPVEFQQPSLRRFPWLELAAALAICAVLAAILLPLLSRSPEGELASSAPVAAAPPVMPADDFSSTDLPAVSNSNFDSGGGKDDATVAFDLVEQQATPALQVRSGVANSPQPLRDGRRGGEHPPGNGPTTFGLNGSVTGAKELGDAAGERTKSAVIAPEAAYRIVGAQGASGGGGGRGGGGADNYFAGAVVAEVPAAATPPISVDASSVEKLADKQTQLNWQFSSTPAQKGVEVAKNKSDLAKNFGSDVAGAPSSPSVFYRYVTPPATTATTAAEPVASTGLVTDEVRLGVNSSLSRGEPKSDGWAEAGGYATAVRSDEIETSAGALVFTNSIASARADDFEGKDVAQQGISGKALDAKRVARKSLNLASANYATQSETRSVNRQRKLAEKKPLAAGAIDRDGDYGDANASLYARVAPIPQPEILTSENNFSTFSLNVSDVSFKLAAASLERGQMPDVATIRSEEFINAFNYRDPEARSGSPVAFVSEQARYPFAHNRDLLRFSVKAGATGRQEGRALNIVLVLDNSGSMERADRVRIVRAALKVLAGQLQATDKLSIVTFARTPHLVADGVAGTAAAEAVNRVADLTPEGGTNLEAAMKLAYQAAARHFQATGINRLVLLTDGAANLGDVAPESLQKLVQTQRQQGVALDCFGVGWEGYNDDLLEVLSRHGDGRYGFINSPEAATTEFATQLAGALQVAASDVKVQVEFNPQRVTSFRQIGYAKHQLTKEQFRDNSVDAAEIAAQEAGNALYTVEINPAGVGPVATVRVRYKVPGTTNYREQAWDVPYNGNATALAQSTPALRLAAVAAAFSEWLANSPFAADVSPDALLSQLSGVPETFRSDARPKQLEWMIRQAKSISGK